MLKRNLKSPEREWVLKCNCCRREHTLAGTLQFDIVITWVREQRWKARSHSQIWEHLCPTCQEAKLNEGYLERMSK
jgi:hypothetical protein